MTGEGVHEQDDQPGDANETKTRDSGRFAVRFGAAGIVAAAVATAAGVWMWRRRRPATRRERMRNTLGQVKGELETAGGKAGGRARRLAGMRAGSPTARTRHATAKAAKKIRGMAKSAR